MATTSEYKEWRKQKRNEIRAQRRALTPEQVNSYSQIVLNKVLEHPYLQTPRTIASYMSFAGELDTKEINSKLKERTHQICLP